MKKILPRKVRRFLRCIGRTRTAKLNKRSIELMAKRAAIREATLKKGRDAMEKMNTELTIFLEPNHD